ncbi:uncharacterized protein LOC113492983 isoform X2 [Trichoplusia ni]|uniref:Uncharacterized protein LOC113492983 isoform X2 n=1 Tax=Trichoplusia ni TaxID=7111 RepID=A0A7E5VE70_TRINI|nr:uncharacterized protein LOC113492983 isoform X2 [Trichoplusia ni]
MKVTLNVLFVFGIFNCTSSQYLTIGTNRKTSKSTCDPTSKSSLVEHFFNIIFTEFHNTPPVCVCVQMCPEQPTYCYPNGCLKRAEKNKKVDVPLPVTRLSENTKPIFFIDEKNDFMNDFLTKNYIDESKSVAMPVPAVLENNVGSNLRPDPFKDRYKILFKYKKMPKVELKYNLGEQVKNMKSDVLKPENVDVSKTRWPMNKIDRRLGGQRMYNEPHVQKGTTNPRYFMTMFPDKDIASYPPKYFKRELPVNTNNENKSDSNVDIKAIYVVGKSEAENSGFSLEKLIDSLIESSFDSNNTDLSKNVSEIEIETSISLPILNDSVIIKEHSTIVNNETTNVLSMNFTNENVDKNKYTEEFLEGNNSKAFSQMIATLAKRIDKQNNTSLEMMRRITGEFEFETNVTTTDRPVKQTLTTSTDILTTETTSQPMDYETKTTKKSRQRFVRRLQHSKNN